METNGMQVFIIVVFIIVMGLLRIAMSMLPNGMQVFIIVAFIIVMGLGMLTAASMPIQDGMLVFIIVLGLGMLTAVSMPLRWKKKEKKGKKMMEPCVIISKIALFWGYQGKQFWRLLWQTINSRRIDAPC